MSKNSLMRTALIVLAVSIVSLAGCSTVQQWGRIQSTSSATVTHMPALPAPAPSAPMESFKGSTPYYSADNSVAGGSQNGQDTERKIVRTASVSLEVADIQKALDSISALAVQYDGYVVSSNRYNSGDDQGMDNSIRVPSESQGGDISIRIPADKFDEVMQKLTALAVKILSQSTNSQDVTEQYTDLQSQLKNQQAAEAQYLEILKKADNVSDILAVQKELTDVRGAIESLQGRIQYLDRTSDMSLIQVTLTKTRPIGESTWDVPGIFKSAVDGLITFGKGLLSILIWLLVFAPVWIIILVVVWLIVRRVKKMKKA